jgi:5,10-methylenetetrahydromethanopterin reductase
MPSKPSFGIVFLPQFPPEGLVDYARQAEAAGFDTLWLYEDCFYAGAFTSAATILAGTGTIRVGIGLLPATVRNPLFAAMEITTLACLYPGRFIPGFGHGYEPWMKQIGVYPKSTMKALEETVTAVRSLLSGEETTLHGAHIYLDRVKLLLLPQRVPPLYVGAIREKTLRLAGRIGDGTILSTLSSPAYLRWAKEQIAAGAAGSKQSQNILSVGVACKVNPDSAAARRPVRRWLAENIQDGGPHLIPLGIDDEARSLFQSYGLEEGTQKMPEDWVDELSASGTPEQALATVKRLVDAGADEVVLTPVDLDPAPMLETIRHFMPRLKKLRL